jgi:hypothetical protein
MVLPFPGEYPDNLPRGYRTFRDARAAGAEATIAAAQKSVITIFKDSSRAISSILVYSNIILPAHSMNGVLVALLSGKTA